MKFAVIVFPGSNCDHDAYYALNKILGEVKNLEPTLSLETIFFLFLSNTSSIIIDWESLVETTIQFLSFLEIGRFISFFVVKTKLFF